MNGFQWPDGKKFAFTIFDDTDLQTAENVRPLYAFLLDHGFRTTKSVWPIKGNSTPKIGGATCEDREYLDWVLTLKEEGVEIGLHNVTYHTSRRDDTLRGLETFERMFGHSPCTMANHTGCAEAIYWGKNRLTGLQRHAYNLLHLNRKNNTFQGHIEDSPLFWGDVCKDKIKYVRNFIFNDINTLKLCPFMPYHDPDRPYVNYWFACSEGPNVEQYNYILAEHNQDRLLTEGGASIIYTHFASGFVDHGQLNRRFVELMQRISKMDGWFVPVGTLLDYILSTKGHYVIRKEERSRLERNWFIHKLINTRGRT